MNNSNKNTQPVLTGLKVLDLTRVLAGPWACQTLADLGADVIKIEHVSRGDDTRQWKPPEWKPENPEGADPKKTMSAYFMSANRNKRSLAIDISTSEGQAIIHELALQSDIVVENFRLGKLKEYGLDYETLSKMNPRLVYCSITGFGQTGPYADKGGYDLMIQAMSGLMSITGKPDHEEGGGPVKVGVALIDIMTGLYSTIAILGAIRHRDIAGVGQYIDMSLFDVGVATLANQSTNYLVSGESPKRMGGAHPNIVPYQVFKAKDDYWILAVGNDEQFKLFCHVAGRPELFSEEKYSTNANRVKHREELIPILECIISKQSRDWWIEHLENSGVPCGPINNIEQALNHPQAEARQLKISLPDEDGNHMPGIVQPIWFSKSQIDYHNAPPHLGQHTDEVLSSDLNMTISEIEKLKQKNIVC